MRKAATALTSSAPDFEKYLLVSIVAQVKLAESIY